MASEPVGIWGDLALSAFVEASPLFRPLDDDARRDLLRVAELVVYQPGEVLMRQGVPGDELFLLREGTAVVRLESGGVERDVAYLDRGAVFGEFVALGSPVRLTTVVARSEVRVVRFPGPVIAALVERFPRLRRLLDALATARHQPPG